MRYYYNTVTDQYAKVLEKNDSQALVVIRDRAVVVNWNEFISEFKPLECKDERSNRNQR